MILALAFKALHAWRALPFMEKIRHRFALSDIDYDNHTGRGKQVYICIHYAQYKHTEQESKCLHP